MRGNKSLFPPPSYWTRGLQEGEESLSSSVFCFVYAREMRKIKWWGDLDGQPLKGGILSGFHVSSCMGR
jgi:hypothetical protein